MCAASPSTVADQKSRRILDAARRVLARRGFAGTTINLVAAEAGVSRGLLHYYFKNKEDMLARVIHENMAASVTLIAAMLSASRSAEDFAHQLVAALRDIFQSDPDFFNLFFEAWAVARQSPAMEAELQALYGHFRQAIETGLQEAAARGHITPALPPAGLSAVLTSIIDGLGLQLITETELLGNEELWDTTVQAICMLLSEDR